VGTLLLAALLLADLTMGPVQLGGLVAIMVVGALPFCAIGLCLGAYSSGSAAPAFANLIYLPSLWLSGIFFPLPEVLRPWAVIWPTFHLNQVAMAAVGIDEYLFIDPKRSIAALLGVTVLFGGLALRRLARVG
jgi:ABC-2 type transport system permease protein